MPLCLSHNCFEYCWCKSIIDFYYWSCIWQTCSSLLFVLILSDYFIFQGKGPHHQQRTVLSLPFQPLHPLFCLLLAVAGLRHYVLRVCCCCLVAKLCPIFATPWTIAPQAPLSVGLPRQEYWSGLPFPSPDELSISSDNGHSWLVPDPDTHIEFLH